MSEPERGIAVVELIRSVAWYRRDDESLVGESLLRPINLIELQRIFKMAEDDPMVEIFPIHEREAKALRCYAPVPIELERYDYFLEATATEPNALNIKPADLADPIR